MLAFARKLLPAATFSELLVVAREEVRAAVGYEHVWFMVADEENPHELHLIEYSGEKHAEVWKVAPVLTVTGDLFLEEVVRSDVPIVIEDARTDPRTNKQMVETLQNRTLIKIPLRLLDKPLGVFGLGTFGDEGCRAPTSTQLDYLVGMASQISVAAGRIRFIEARLRADNERQELERRLAQSQKLESLGMLAGGIAHDFNNLLTVILSGAGLVRASLTDPTMRADIDAVIDAGDRASQLTRQLLAMSRDQDLRLEPTDVNSRLRSLLDLVRRVFPETIELTFAPSVDLPIIVADQSQLDQVFMNICINARDAMPAGGRFTIRTEQVALNSAFARTHPWTRGGDYVLVSFVDTGVGMPHEVMDRIFEPFFTTKGPLTGTGLGLAVSYGIVRQHRGVLQCHSEPGAGTTFNVYLEATHRLTPEVAAKRVVRIPNKDGVERILLAEDDPAVREVAQRILSSRGNYEVIAVESGDAACKRAEDQEFDLVVLDVVMPGMSCRDVVQRLRELRPGIPIVLASGYAAGENLAELSRDFDVEFLRKPYDPDSLLDVIRRLLDGPVA
ncbi:MAG TPA: ATP-binding protein [Polyangiaceae bacterium]|nr:ATP-binding protein [Polyangiaceae bacterium]